MGRERLISPEDATDIREAYASPRRQPNGRYTSMDVLAHLNGVSVGTIQQIVDYRGVYSTDRRKKPHKGNKMRKARIEQCDNGYIVWLEDKKGETAKRLVFENVDLALVCIKEHMVMENDND